MSRSRPEEHIVIACASCMHYYFSQMVDHCPPDHVCSLAGIRILTEEEACIGCNDHETYEECY